MQMTGILKNINVKKSPPTLIPTAGNRGASSSFDFNPIANPSVVVGGIAPSTATRASIATIVDFEGYVREVLSGEKRFNGMRRVENLLRRIAGANSATLAGSTVSGATLTGPDSDGFYTLTRTGATGSWAHFNFTGNIGYSMAGRTYIVRVEMKAVGTMTDFRLNVSDVLGVTSSSANLASQLTTSAQVFSHITTGTTFTNTGRLGAFGVTLNGANGESLKLRFVQCEDVTGQANTAPSEYLSVGVLASPWQGANVDGVQYFNTANGNVINQNILIRSQDFSAAGWALDAGGAGVAPTVTSGFADPLGGNTAARVQLNKGTGVGFSRIRQVPVTSATVPAYTVAVWMKSNTSSSYVIRLLDGANADVGVNQTVDGTWRRFWVTNASLSASHTFEVLLWDSPFPTSDTADILIAFAQMNPGYSPGAYVATTTVAIVNATITEAGGPLLPVTNSMGSLEEPTAATDLLLARADARDMTTANWALGATLTRARTQVGWDGQANFATLLTGGAVAATNRITMTFVLAAASRTYSVGIKRITGVGAVLISQDNFATSTDISAQLNSATFTLVQINANQLNPVIGVQVSVNGDQIACDWNQYSTGNLVGLINSRIPTTITTRNADVLTYSVTGWLNPAAGTIFTEYFNPNATPNNMFVAALSDGTVNNSIGMLIPSPVTAGFNVATGGVNQVFLNAASTTANAIAKSVGIYQVNDFAGFANNTSLGTDVAGTIPTVTQMEISNSFGFNPFGHCVRRVVYYPYRMNSATAQALTV